MFHPHYHSFALLLIVIAPATSWGQATTADSSAETKPSRSRVQPLVDSSPSRTNVDDFERTVRPVLVEHCQSCHGPRKQEGGLRLDSGKALQRTGGDGAVVVPGEPERSRLMKAIRYADDIKMPPKGKLSEKDIAALEKWIKNGAAWPKEEATSGKPTAEQAATSAKDHWAFQSIDTKKIPSVKGKERVADPIDSFVLAKLEPLGMTLSPEAERRTLIRRATFDLHGLPPSPDDLSSFESDRSPDAYRKLIERLLSSPRYGERWGRHWLDVARYSDTKGYVRLNENPRYPSSWTYRDYVIDAFNRDLPFDRFLLEQLAADQLDLNDDRRPLAALGFLTLGQRFLNSQPDIIDDRIDVVTRGLLGVSVACARCHDHKFDPVSTREYYGLYGVFANSVEPPVPPLIVPESQQEKYAAYLKELRSRSDQLSEYLRTQQALLTKNMRSRAAEYLLAGQHEPIQANFLAVMFLIDAKKDLNPVMTQRWARYLDQADKRHDPVLAPWRQLAVLAKQGDTEQAVSESLARWRPPAKDAPRQNRLVVEALEKAPPKSLVEVSQLYGRLLKESEERWEQHLQQTPTADKLDDPEWEEIRRLLMGPESPFTFAVEDVEEFLFVDATTQQQLHAKQRLVTDWIGSADAAPHAMALEDVRHPTDSRVFIRGNASNPGEVAPRQFLAALSRSDPVPFQHGSGRLELARAIASPENPLTARVFVNRVWQHHFGAGLVRTPSDFGTRGERPSHPELLDHLAHRFVTSGWSIKQLHRDIMLSATYRQQSTVAAEGKRESSPRLTETKPLMETSQSDPDNVLLARQNRRRLDWESLRDSLLAVSGQLDLTMGGPAVELFPRPFALVPRRSIYGLVDRQNLPGELRIFDFAPPDTTSSQRHQTTVPQQALFLMNGPFLRQIVSQLATLRDLVELTSNEQRIERVYKLLFARHARPEEVQAGIEYLTTGTPTPATETPTLLTPWEEYLQVLLMSNEFVFVD